MPTQGKKKCTPPNTTNSTQGGQTAAPTLPDEDEFRQHLRQLARSAIRVLLEDVMRCAASAHVRSLQRSRRLRANGPSRTPPLPGGETQRGKEHGRKAAKREGMYREALQVLSAW
jgi:hypothetical protein